MVVAHKSSTEEIGILRKLFNKYDSRHDGSIWFEEFCAAMSGSGLSNEELQILFDAMVSLRQRCPLYHDSIIDCILTLLIWNSILGSGWQWQNTIHGVHRGYH